jgi:hypothetical protein
MYERIDPSDGPLVGLRIREEITDRETQELVHLIQERSQQYGPVRLLVVYEADTGLMGAESLYENLRFAKLASEKLAKMAVVGKRDWENTWVGLFGLFGGVQTAYFDLGQLQAALAWLKE